jgi:hypothetical protein
VALPVSGRLDKHFTVLWDGGHIKFLSIATLRQLLAKAGFSRAEIIRAGQIAPLAKSMIAMVRRG